MEKTIIYFFDYHDYHMKSKNMSDYIVIESLYNEKKMFIISKNPYIETRDIQIIPADFIVFLTAGQYENKHTDNVLLVNVFVPFNRNAILKLKKGIDFAVDVYTIYIPGIQNHSVLCFIIEKINVEIPILTFLHQQFKKVFFDDTYKIVRINYAFIYGRFIAKNT